MQTWKVVLICTGMTVVVVWLAVLICALSDKLKGHRPPEFDEDEPAEQPTSQALRYPWWRHALLSPFYALFILVTLLLGVLFLPMVLVEWLWRETKPNKITGANHGQR